MRTPLIASAAALLALTAAPAFAAPAKDAPQPTSQNEGVAQNEDAGQARADTRYCVQTKTTGSRLARKVCKTRADWIADQDYDPLAPQHVTR